MRGYGGRAVGVGALAAAGALALAVQAMAAGWTTAQLAGPPASALGTVESYAVGVDGSGAATVAWNGGFGAASVRSLRPGGTLRRLPAFDGLPDRLVVTPGGQWYASGYGGRGPTRPWTARLVGGRWVVTERGDRGRTAVAALATRGEELLVGVVADQYAAKTELTTFRQPLGQRSFPLGSHPVTRGPWSSGAVFLGDGSAAVLEPTTGDEVPEDSRLTVLGPNPNTVPVPGVVGEPEIASDGERIVTAGVDPEVWGDIGPIGPVRVAVGTRSRMTPLLAVEPARRALYPRIALIPGGPAIVTWVEKAPAPFREYGVARWAAIDMTTGAVTASGALSRSGYAYAPEVAVVGDRVAAVWGEGLPSKPGASVWRAAALDGSRITPLGNLPGRSVGGREYVPSLEIAGGGGTIAAVYSDGADGRLRYAVRRVR